MKFIFSKQLSMANVAIVYLNCNAEISGSKEEGDQTALISLRFRESPEIPSPLMSRTEPDVSFS